MLEAPNSKILPMTFQKRRALWLTIDIFGQGLLLLVLFCTAATSVVQYVMGEPSSALILLLVNQLLLGLWQVLSMIIGSTDRYSRWRRNFLNVVLGYLLFALVILQIRPYSDTLYFVLLIVLPSVSACWYFARTRVDWLRRHKESTTQKINIFPLDD